MSSLSAAFLPSLPRFAPPIFQAGVQAPAAVSPALSGSDGRERKGASRLGMALCMAGAMGAARSARKSSRRVQQPADAETPRLTTRKKSDPQNITMLDMGTAYTVKEDLNKPTITTASGHEEKITVRKRENVKDPKELISEVAAEAPDMDEDFLKDLLEMTAVEWADLIEELTRKAFVLMEAGEIPEAKQHLDRASRIAGAFDRLNQEFEIIREKKSAQRRDETQVVLELQKELDQEDFNMIFSAKAKLARFIGGI